MIAARVCTEAFKFSFFLMIATGTYTSTAIQIRVYYALAQRRADAVARKLKTALHGAIPIEAVSYGERYLEHKTLDGVNSAENRNAAIYIRR